MSTEHIRVLLVEDDRKSVRLIQAMLGAVTTVAFEVESAERLSDALLILAAGEIDVVLLDLSLPDSRGIETLTKIQDRMPAVPVVVLTVLDDEAVAVKAVEMGAQDYLVKGQADQNLLARSLRYAIGRNRAEAEIRHSQRRLQALLENSSDGVLIVDKSLNAKYANSSAMRLFGLQDFTGEGNGFDAIHPDDLPEVINKLQSLWQTPGATVYAECRARYGDGPWLHLAVTAKSLLEDPAVQGIVINFRDITQYKTVEGTLRHRLELGQLASSIASRFLDAHDLDSVITDSLKDIGTFTGVRRVYAFILSEESSTIADVYEWCAEGMPSQKEEIRSVPSESLQWWRTRFAEETYISTQKVSKASLGEGSDLLSREGVKSALVIPLYSREGIAGAVGLDNIPEGSDWNDADVLLPIMVAQVISSALDRRNAEESLDRSEQSLRTILDRIPDSVIVLNANGTMRYHNPAAMRMGKYEQGKGNQGTLLDKNLFGALHPDDEPKAMRTLAEALQKPGTDVSVECRFLRQDGTWGYLEVVGTNLLGDPAVRGIVLVARDITERRKSEEAVRESEEKYRNVVELATEGIIIIQDGIIKYTNPAMAIIGGYELNEGVGKSMVDFLHPDYLAGVMERYKRRMAGEELSKTYESALLAKDGGKIDVEVTASLVMYQGKPADMVMIRDIRERKWAEAALRRSEEKLKEMVEKLRLSQEALSTPVVRIWDGVLAMPLIGVVDEQRAQLVMEVLLGHIVATQSEQVILDVTGVASMDADVANYVMQTVRSASLLGTKCIITGMRPDVAQTVVDLGLDMNRVVIKKDMREGLRWALHTMGYHLRNGHAVR